MHVSEQVAYDAMMGVINTGWLADPVTTAIPLFFDDRREDPPGADANGDQLPWARASIAPVDTEPQGIGPIGSRKFQEVAIATIQVFTKAGDGRDLSNAIMEAAKLFIRGSAPTDIEIQLVGPVERVGQDGAYFVANLPIQFVYYQVG